jgi:hypothetical protein
VTPPAPARRRARLLATALACAAVALGSAAASATAASSPLWTSVVDPSAYYGPPAQLQTAFAHTRAAGASFVRIYVNWAATAPANRPAGFNPANPGDPGYNWAQIDSQVVLAERAHLQPVLSVNFAPGWAERGRRGNESQFPLEFPGAVNPDPHQYGLFAQAIGQRYSGHFHGLPRVKYWQAWNEPNWSRFLVPQFSGPEPTSATPPSQTEPRSAHPVSPALYRALVNAFGHAIHRVHRDNIVIAGGTAPYARPWVTSPAVAALVFMRDFLCIGPNDKPRRGCGKIDFDVWAHHPYTDGNPEHRAHAPGNVPIPLLPQMRRVLDVAARAGHISAGRRVGFWVSEISWNSNPPSPGGVPLALEARWVSEGLFRMWQSGVSVVTWYLLRDDPVPQPPLPSPQYLSGLYTTCQFGLRCDTAKLIFYSFRFPFVAYHARGGAFVWGRTPWGARGTVVVEQLRGRRWVRLATLRTNGVGIFSRTVRVHGGGDLRARLRRGGLASVPFSLHPPRDMPVNPFG